MSVGVAETYDQIQSCWPVIHQLRPHVLEEGFARRMRELQRSGYKLAYLREGRAVVAVAGYRLVEQLARGRVLHIDDLVTDQQRRGQGFGRQLMQWLLDHARRPE